MFGLKIGVTSESPDKKINDYIEKFNYINTQLILYCFTPNIK